MRFFPRYGQQTGSRGGVSSTVGSKASGGAGAGARPKSRTGPEARGRPSVLVIYSPLPIHQTKTGHRRLGPGAGVARCSGLWAKEGARGLLAPRRPPSRLPRQLAAEQGPPSPGSRPSSPPARPAARPLPICREAQGESAGSRARGHRRPGSREKKVSALSSCTSLPRSGLGCGGIQALRYSAAISHAEPDEGLGYFLGSPGEGGQEGALPLGKA